jgi:hypothetical protein
LIPSALAALAVPATFRKFLRFSMRRFSPVR